ncbi:zinc ribbon domain-containing protein [Acutalibacter caecimuris]|uniref:zinc ribbon domain-containing protein n=1 Tax=Acutalibacter caecimuris TaxID=3093657 RepID=UPI002AC8D9BF|nr:zinc ribbon domain-containing protein [Acutalibacter sp. M00118]
MWRSHPATIDKATFDYVQEEMARRREVGCFANKALNLSCFSSKTKCGNCDRSFVRSARKQGGYVIWTCGSKKGRTASCGARDIPEKLLKGVCSNVLGTDEFNESAFAERIESIVVIGKDTTEFRFYSGEVKGNLTPREPCGRRSARPCGSNITTSAAESARVWGSMDRRSVATNGKKSNGETGYHKQIYRRSHQQHKETPGCQLCPCVHGP